MDLLVVVVGRWPMLPFSLLVLGPNPIRQRTQFLFIWLAVAGKFNGKALVLLFFFVVRMRVVGGVGCLKLLVLGHLGVFCFGRN